MTTPEQAYKEARKAIDTAEDEGRVMCMFVSTDDGMKLISNVPVTKVEELKELVHIAMQNMMTRFQN